MALGFALLRQLNEVCDRQRPVRLHDDVVDDRTLPGLALTDFYHEGLFKKTLRAVTQMNKTGVLFKAHDLQELTSVARQLSAEIRPPLLVLLSGNLGAGKTTFVSAVLKAWGVAGANSPTFNLRNDYELPWGRVIHIDFYRLKNGDAAFDVLPFDEDYSDAVVFVEWADKAPKELFAGFSAIAKLTIHARTDGVRELTWQR